MSTQQFADFARTNNLFLDAVYIGQRCDTETKTKTKWRHYLWVCTLGPKLAAPYSLPEKTHTFEYRTGLGHSKTSSMSPGFKAHRLPVKPAVADVLYSLQVDCRSGEYLTFEDFASDLGYDQDSREAERTYDACKHVRRAMLALLGNEAFITFLALEEQL